MSRMRLLLLLPVLLCGLLAGCGVAPIVGADAVVPVARVAAAPPAGSVAITGDVKAPTVLTPEALARYPQKVVPVTFRSGTVLEAHTFSGVLLADVLPPAALAQTSAKNSFLSFAVLGKATDGYAALVSYGELAPDFGGKQILIAGVQDGKKLAQPRLVVPGDGRGGRYVTDLIELKVVRVS